MSATTRLMLHRGHVGVGPDLTVAVGLTLHEPRDLDRRVLAKVLNEFRGKPPQLIEMSLMGDQLMLVIKSAEHVEGVLAWLVTASGDMPSGRDRVAAKYDELHGAIEQAQETAIRALAAFKLA